ncbi:MAG: transposase [Vicinamibacterales bacterium]
MSRPLRLHAPGLLHHVFARGNDKACIFVDDTDCENFLELLGATLERFGVRCAAYCLLWNHYHLLLVPREPLISRLMQQLNSAYCQRFNRRHKRVGHVLQGRFGSRLVEDGCYARTVLRYIALNPVAAERASCPDEWRWSSYRVALGLETAPAFLSLELVWSAFGTSDADVGRARFAEFVRAGLQEDLVNPLLHGSDQLANRVAPELEGHQATRDFVYPHRFAARPSLGALLEGCLGRVTVENAAHSAFHRHGYTLAELGGALSRDPSTICRWIRRAAARKSQRDPELSPGEAIDARNKI